MIQESFVDESTKLQSLREQTNISQRSGSLTFVYSQSQSRDGPISQLGHDLVTAVIPSVPPPKAYTTTLLGVKTEVIF